jgi:hypothetical protein
VGNREVSAATGTLEKLIDKVDTIAAVIRDGALDSVRLARFEIGGRVLLGLDPDAPNI